MDVLELNKSSDACCGQDSITEVVCPVFMVLVVGWVRPLPEADVNGPCAVGIKSGDVGFVRRFKGAAP